MTDDHYHIKLKTPILPKCPINTRRTLQPSTTVFTKDRQGPIFNYSVEKVKPVPSMAYRY